MVPIVQQFLPFSAQQGSALVAWLAFAGAAGGGVLWLFGSRFSRSLVTLLGVAVGASVGLHLPRWFEIPVGSWATAVGGALVLGIAGYALHTLWAGLALGLLLAGWAAVGTWVACRLPADWTVPGRPAGMSHWDYAGGLWQILPKEMRQVAPFLCGIGFAAGTALGVFWSRLSIIVLHSAAGVTLLVGLGLVAMELGRPTMLRIVPETQTARLTTILLMAIFGVVVQWRLSPSAKAAGESKEED